MPFSHNFGKDWIKSKIEPNSKVLDIGAGSGTYADLLKDLNVQIDGVEVFYPYVKKYSLTKKYNRIIIADVWYLDKSLYRIYEYIILGDVLEHFPKDKAMELICLIKRNIKETTKIIVSLPITDYPQGEVNGNPYEEHLTQWTHEKFTETFEVKDFTKNETIGVYVL